jgi:hypothetical protein
MCHKVNIQQLYVLPKDCILVSNQSQETIIIYNTEGLANTHTTEFAEMICGLAIHILHKNKFKLVQYIEKGFLKHK